MIYNAYKTARNAAWQVLIDYNITELPVSVSKICSLAGIKIVKNSTANELHGNEVGASIYANGKWYIIYDDEMPPGRKRFTIAHELGHIFLGHPLTDGIYLRKFNINKPKIEMEADMFASRLLAPACVLHEIGITDAEDIAKICKISISAAKRRAERMEVLESRGAWYQHPLEILLKEQFKDFIEGNK